MIVATGRAASTTTLTLWGCSMCSVTCKSIRMLVSRPRRGPMPTPIVSAVQSMVVSRFYESLLPVFKFKLYESLLLVFKLDSNDIHIYIILQSLVSICMPPLEPDPTKKRQSAKHLPFSPQIPTFVSVKHESSLRYRRATVGHCAIRLALSSYPKPSSIRTQAPGPCLYICCSS
jgi:hypothetical protein